MDYAVIMDKVDTLSKPMMYKSLLEGTLIVKKQKHFKLGMLHLPHLLLYLLRLLLFHLQLPSLLILLLLCILLELLLLLILLVPHLLLTL